MTVFTKFEHRYFAGSFVVKITIFGKPETVIKQNGSGTSRIETY